MSDYKQCPYRKEGLYAKDCWMTYNACILHSDMWDYYTCDPNADYCEFGKANSEEKEKLINQKKQKDKDEKLKRLMIDIDWKQREIMQLEKEIEELMKQVNDLNNI
jgi:hypothetical protein